ncbi:hypothetical protein M514_11559, partial [Trichuris suis]
MMMMMPLRLRWLPQQCLLPLLLLLLPLLLLQLLLLLLLLAMTGRNGGRLSSAVVIVTRSELIAVDTATSTGRPLSMGQRRGLINSGAPVHWTNWGQVVIRDDGGAFRNC